MITYSSATLANIRDGTDGKDGVLYPNLSPFFSHDLTDIYNAETNPNGYWMENGSSYGWTKNSKFTFTQLEDGWLHVHIDNSSGTSIIRNDCCVPRYNPSIKKGTMYTFFAEFRNNQSTGIDATSNFYLVQQSGSVQFWGTNTATAPSVKLEGIGGLSTRVIDIPLDGSYVFSRGTKYSEPDGDSSHWTTEDAMVTFTFRANAGAVIDYDIRLSVYEGEYWGNYVPYIISDVTDIRNSAETANNKIDNLEIGGRNLLKTEPKKYVPTDYSAYEFTLTEPLEANQTYTIQLWNVDVSHSAKTEDQLGINVYYCGGTVRFGTWQGTNYFVNGHADHLILTFTPTEDDISHSNVVNATTKFIRLYNSYPNTSGTRNMSIEKWKLEKGNKATDWTPAPEDIENDITEAKKTATNYISSDNTGIMVADLADGEQLPANATGKNVFITAGYGSGDTAVDAGVHIRNGQEDLAFFGKTAQIGKSDQGHIILDNDSVDIKNNNNVLASFGATSVIGDENDWHQTIAANQITFAKGNDIITYISPDKLYTINAEVADAFYISNYSIRNASDGKLVIGLRR